MLAFKRMYVDIPTDTHEKLVIEAAARGMSQKGLLAQLIEDCVMSPKRKRATAKKSVKRKSKAKRKPARRKRQ